MINLNGLENLEYVDGSFTLQNNGIIDNISALSNLSHINGNLVINDNPNLSSTIAWKFKMQYDGWLRREYYKISTLSDGSIVGYGQWGNVFYDPVIKRTPWIIKVSSEGEQIWQKILYDVFPGEEVAKSGLFFDGVELADGGFMVVGGLTEAPGEATKILISRLNEEGCLIDDCPWVYHMGDLLNGVVHTEEEKGIDIYPNPASGMVHVECAAKIRHISVMDITGKLISRYFIDRRNTNIDLGAFEDGVYIFRIVDEGGKVETRKVIKL